MNEEHRQVSAGIGLAESQVNILTFSFSFFYKPELWLAGK